MFGAGINRGREGKTRYCGAMGSKRGGTKRRSACRYQIVIPGWSEGPDPESRDSGFALRAPRNDGESSPFHERLLDHKMARLVAAAFEEAAGFEHLAQFFEHAGAAAHHDAVGGDVER